jgi:ribosome-binding protein aMBF1 (putative translation factor)
VYFEAGRKLPKMNEMRIYSAIRQFCDRQADSDGDPQAGAAAGGDVASSPSDNNNWMERAERLKGCRKTRQLSHDDVAQEINRRYTPKRPLNGKLIWNLEKVKEGNYRQLVWDLVCRWLEEEEEKKANKKVAATNKSKDDAIVLMNESENSAASRPTATPLIEPIAEEDITEDSMTQLSNELRTARYRLGLSQDDLALQLNKWLTPPIIAARKTISQVGYFTSLPKIIIFQN